MQTESHCMGWLEDWLLGNKNKVEFSADKKKPQNLHLSLISGNGMCEVCAAHFYQVTGRLEKHQPSCIFSQQLSYHMDCLYLF